MKMRAARRQRTGSLSMSLYMRVPSAFCSPLPCWRDIKSIERRRCLFKAVAGRGADRPPGEARGVVQDHGEAVWGLCVLKVKLAKRCHHQLRGGLLVAEL